MKRLTLAPKKKKSRTSNFHCSLFHRFCFRSFARLQFIISLVNKHSTHSKQARQSRGFLTNLSINLCNRKLRKISFCIWDWRDSINNEKESFVIQNKTLEYYKKLLPRAQEQADLLVNLKSFWDEKICKLSKLKYLKDWSRYLMFQKI